MHILKKGLYTKDRAFTIIEVLLALALIGLVAGLFAVNFDVLLSSIVQKRPEKVLREAICEARYQSLQLHSMVYLTFDEEKHSFVILKDAQEPPIITLPIQEGIKVIFEPIPPNEYKRGGFEEASHSQKIIKKIAFSPDGSSQPVIIILGQDNFSLKFKPDPLSCGMISV